VTLSEPVRAALAATIERLRPFGRDVAWVTPANLHVTLKFLGHLEDSRVGDVEAALRSVTVSERPFDVSIAGLGAFPSPTRPRVVWAGVGGPEVAALVRLAERTETALGPLGFEREARVFSPHVTLGRVRQPRRDPALVAALGDGTPPVFGNVRVDRLVLMRSDLSPGGARYTEIVACALGGG
jgi:2'-5' RNA ligase